MSLRCRRVGTTIEFPGICSFCNGPHSVRRTLEMKRWTLALAVLLCGTLSAAYADYVILIYNLGQSKGQSADGDKAGAGPIVPGGGPIRPGVGGGDRRTTLPPGGGAGGGRPVGLGAAGGKGGGFGPMPPGGGGPPPGM